MKEEFEITLHVPKSPVFDRSWCVEGGETNEEARNRGERAVVRGEEEEAGTGGRLARGRRPCAWPETKEEKEDMGSRAGKREEEEEEERKGGRGSRVP